MKRWDVIESRQVADYWIFKARVDRLRSPKTGNPHDFVVLETPDWINVIAITPDDQAILVRQIRHGTGDPFLEIPGGLVDPGESPLEAAKRELLEETGYQAERWRELGCVHPNPAFQDNRCTTFLAEGCRKVAELHLDGSEDITVELHPVSQLRELVSSGQITHAMVIVAFYWLFTNDARP